MNWHNYRIPTHCFLTRDYACDAFGNIEQITDNETASQTQAFQYDPLSRLADAQGNYGHQAFAYDENGNRETLTQDGIPESLIYDSLSDQLEEKGTQSRSYDLTGNTLTRGSDAFTYDDRNRLVSVTVDGTTTSYQYNGIGERTQKTTNGESRHFLYGKDGKLLMERDGDSLRLRQYVYLDDRPIAVFDVERQLADTPPAECGGATVNLTDLTVGTGETLACTASTELTTGNGAQETGFNISAGGQALLQAPVVRLLPNTHIQAGAELHISPTSVEDFESQYLFSSANIYYLHTDHLNTTRAITDAGQNLVWRWDSDPFGTSTPTSNGFVFNQRFPGQYFDEESGLHYNYFRDYEPSTGRYLQSDPIGLLRDYSDPQLQTAIQAGFLEEAGFVGEALNHLYGYLGQNPLDWYDRYGLAKNKNKARPVNPNKKPPPPHRIPGGERERNRGHKDGEEHSRTPKGSGNYHREASECGDNCQKSLVWTIVTGVGWVLLNACTLGAAGS